MRDAYLYLLVDAGGLAFKIGVSVDPLRRATVLPQTIDHTRSLQIPMTGGAAYEVERVLHYLFRDQAAPQPPGDGYTEWFDMAAWSDVLAFLAEQRERLGVGKPESIPSPVIRAVVQAPDPAVIEARRLRAEAKEREFIRRQEERLPRAIKHNGQTVAWLRAFMAELEAAQAIKGILVYNDLRIGPHGELSAELFLSGGYDDVARWAEDALAVNVFRHMLRGRSNGGSTIFSGGYWREGAHRGLAVIGVETKLLALPDEWAECIPFAADVHRVLLPWVARKGSRLGPQLLRLHRWVAADRRELPRQIARASQGVWA